MLKKKIIAFVCSPPHFFLLCSLFFGSVFLILTPPFQVADEINHFYRAYQISEGQLLAVKNQNRLGGFMPTGILSITEPFKIIRWDLNQKINPKEIINELKNPLGKEHAFVDFPNTVIYSPISYLPQSLGVLLSRQFTNDSLFLFYVSRFFALLFWTGFVFFL